jgi:putative zinc finger protein
MRAIYRPLRVPRERKSEGVSDTGKNSEPLDAILRRAMHQPPGAATPECADAESLAAYWDKSISAADRDRLETHLGGCARCLAQLAAIARAIESARDAKSASEVPWYRRWRIAIPAIAVAAVVVVVFIAMRRPAIEESRTDQLAAMAKREAPVAELAAKPPLAPAVPATAPTGPASIAAAPASNEIAMNEAKTAAAPRAEAMSGGAMTHRMADSATAPAARAMTAPAVEARSAGAPEFGGAVAAGKRAVAGGAMSALQGTPAQPVTTISAPDQSVSWIAGKNGMVQRRDADGSTHIQQSGVSTDLVAGSSASATVCWIVGKNGTIIRTTDGEHWMRISSPTSDNLTAVSAASANDATITTADGQRFATSDGGASWHPQ